MDHTDIKIRAVSVLDAEDLLRIYAPYVIKTAVTFEYEAPSVQEFANRISRTLEKYPYIAACCGKEIVGYAYAGPFQQRPAYDWTAETSIYVDESQKGMGIGKKLYQALEKILSAQNILNVCACIAYPPAEDEFLTKSSAAFHFHMGYRFVGEFHQCGYKFGRWYNMVWMEKHIGPHPEHQPPVIAFDKIRNDIPWQN
ncbi:GNAT family N-acetyltransferase [Cuneatibacter caecimuris]|uniref:Phosphinothricin acetyltransferase n=1 Tax=Cuneatibacter caecimuris TaxID=1796618 RepID=A0A4Q7PSP4_9FIRM|nr:GNAT family N-acetyltransferase [Cuneatibacter caecimuris]RZT02310.1 phosphinothricin acetyltransferase [Cuneatibacter caecimuris]